MRSYNESHRIIHHHNYVTTCHIRYSKVLISDHAVPDKGAPYILASLDWEPMNYLAAAERTKSQ